MPIRSIRIELRLLAFVLLTLLLIPTSCLQAQTVSGTILGNILDSSGSVVPNAQITVTNQDTGVVRTTVGTADGVYNVPSLLPGKYTVEAKAQGFSPAEVKDVVLNVGSDTTVDLRLQVGAVTQSVTVTEAIPTVETTSSEVSQVVNEDLIKQIPLNARDVQQLAIIQPGVQAMNTSYGGRQITVSGDRPSNNRYLQEGMDMTWSYRLSPISLASGILLGTEAIKEFKVQTSNFTVEYGEQSGGVVNTLFKSGSNALHGSAYEYYRNAAFDARNFFDYTANGAPPPFQRHQYGASIGGPIRKDKTFFFVNFEGFNHSRSESLIANLPDDPSRATASAGVAKIFFNGANPLIPHCNGPSLGGGLCQYNSSPIENIDEKYVVGKIDHSFGSKNTLSATYNMDTSWRVTPVQTGLTADDVTMRRQTFTLQDTHILSSNLVNTFRFGVNRIYFVSEQDLQGDLSRIDPSLVITPIVVPCAHLCSAPTPVLASGLSTAMPPITVPGMTGFFSAINPVQNYAPRWHGYTGGFLSDDINYLNGKHAFQFGFQGKKWQDNIENYMGAPRGQYTFQSLTQFLAGGPAQTFGFDIPGKTNLGRSMRLQYFSLYAQDTYKLKSNLTVTYGLRWEFLSPPSETHGELASSYNPLPQTLPKDGELKGTFYIPSKRNFAPRVGFNWDPFKKGKTSVRGGFGMFFNEVEDNAWFAGVSGTYPFTTAVSLSNLMTLPFQQSILTNAIAAGLANPTAPGGPELHPHTPTRYGYNLMVQHQLPGHISFLVGYVGSVQRHQGRSVQWQEYAPTAVEVPGQVPMFNGQPVTYPVYDPNTGIQTGTAPAPINPDCKAAGQITCLYWAGTGLTNANVLGNNSGSNAPTKANPSAAYTTNCTATIQKNCFVNNNWGNSISSITYDANSSYNSLQASVERQMSPGLYVRFNYTLAKCMEDSGDDLGGSNSNGGQAAFTPTGTHGANRHRCAFQGTSSANLSVNYDLPFGRMVKSGFAKALVSDWQINSQTSLQSGVPFDVTAGVNIARAANSGNGASHPEWLATDPTGRPCNAHSVINKHDVTNYYDTSCFGLPQPGYLGNMGALILTAPGLWNTDVGLRKTIRLRESMALQIGADMFNAFNRSNLSSPALSSEFINTGTAAAPVYKINSVAGQITSTITSSRQMQIGAKFTF